MANAQLSIKSWPVSERPRERLLAQGTEALSDAELLAIILRHGVQGKDAIALGRDLLSQHGGFRELLSKGVRDLSRTKGLGKAKIASLLALSEITKRTLREKIIGKSFIRDPESILDYLYVSLRDRKREVFKVIFLNKANQIIGEKDLFEGTVDSAAVHPREIVKAVLDHHATAVILVHNHPSGRTAPSNEDKDVTAGIVSACQTISTKVLDHLIIGNNQYFSFVEAGLM
ncbi:MAG: hypothetical protein COV74_05775 [Candidatus Omnitrophica bacterium CG11_big_fil_rev_8_21_14_0_20_45_26]|uniref:MPN domain-containing protein n=1 Tax=Candidatus Abzuiibacterium crystallinum TaxID=1974748 RepID=A0A2H0LR84_9BACT|nr:MAG: hypothetical protein COV74_05775 [Candidatus Omnitrophica bacterium CG11_big_fil_rev_8_21_14_0_20_45_26]PIW64078.1 MAG: hypothetical protein COW12_07510 [Candidatus Omnitrophica bacterium CG12_big_fil_rev_8_21_14_0_65_45_16]